MNPTKPTAPHLLAGQAAEDAACAFLLARGLLVVARTFRVRGGEIDIIAREGAVLVFVEVRWRSGLSHGGACASIDSRKRVRIEHAARCYLRTLSRLPQCRLDALCRTGPAEAPWQWIRGM